MQIRCKKRGANYKSMASIRNLNAAIESFGVKDRSWLILDRRIGLGNGATLEVVATELSLTRERVRQLQRRAAETIYCQLDQLSPLLKVYENELDSQWMTEAARYKSADLTHELKSIALRQGWGDAEPTTLLRLILALRAVVDEYPDFARSLPRLTFAACLLNPPVKGHTVLSSSLDIWAQQARDEQRNWTYDELAETVLRAAGEPLHWTVLADRAESLGRRESFFRSPFFNAVQTNDEKFARVDSGTYGLTEWGVSDVPNYTDIVAKILSESDCSLTEGAIFQRVYPIRSVDLGSLRMLLDMNPRFYRSVDAMYGLRSWLQERSRQNLRTPRWLVEDSVSFERVERAERRGYKVEAVVERDRERFPRQ